MLSIELDHLAGRGADAFRLRAAFRAGPGITVLFGPSGAGKSTIVKAVAGLVRPRSGRVAIGGRVLSDSDTGIFLPPWKRRVGLVFQDARLFPHMDVAANLAYGLRWSRDAEAPAGMARIVEMLDIGHLLKRRTGSLSGGERGRVALGRALAARPDVLLLDEPLASLDTARKDEILPFIERLRQPDGPVIVYVTHALEEVVRLADTLVLLDSGGLVAAGPLEELTARLDLVGRLPGDQAGAVMAGRVVRHHPADGLSEIDLGGAALLVPRIAEDAGTALRVRIAARDVSLAVGEPGRISTLNRIPARILELAPHAGDGGMVDVALEIRLRGEGEERGGPRLVARLTRRAATELGLAPGLAVTALVKSVALDRRGA